jgi:hypothetical protein
MNERFKELAEQAYKDVNTNTPSFLVTKEMVDARFAELIVKECMMICADNACRAGGANTQVGEDLYSAVDFIKKHFGVEE